MLPKTLHREIGAEIARSFILAGSLVWAVGDLFCWFGNRFWQFGNRFTPVGIECLIAGFASD
jgi:hypothetical protein